MLDFKQKKALHPAPLNSAAAEKHDMVATATTKLNEERPGWYEGILDFKRVMRFLQLANTNTETHILL